MSDIEAPQFGFALRPDLAEHPEFLPTKTYSTDTGYDVRCAEREGMLIKPFQYVLIPLGIRMFAPKGYYMELRPRSSTHAKKHLHCLYGIIDEEFQSELLMSVCYIPHIKKYDELEDNFLRIEFGDKIGQLVPIKRQEVSISEITNDNYTNLCKIRGGERGTGGFGSTDKK